MDTVRVTPLLTQHTVLTPCSEQGQGDRAARGGPAATLLSPGQALAGFLEEVGLGLQFEGPAESGRGQ